MKKTQVAKLSVASNTILIILKLIVGILTGSVSIISEAIHSTMDLLAAVIAFLSVRISDRPADEKHPYGHGKVENISGVIEALLIFLASVLIIIQAVKKIINPGKIESIGIGFIVMFVAAGVNVVVSKMLYKVAKETESIALEADALHLKTDVYSSLGVGFGLLLIWITGLNYLDPIVAILVAIFILRESIVLLISAFNPLLDGKLSDEELKIIESELSNYNEVYSNYHRLRARRSGSKKYIDLHLVLPDNMQVKQANDICVEIAAGLEKKLTNSEVLIKLEPCKETCSDCGVDCKSIPKTNSISA